MGGKSVGRIDLFKEVKFPSDKERIKRCVQKNFVVLPFKINGNI